ncbi:MAG TPA: extracellular solute-binding protein [Micromonosporaceae bacterium]|nr:extracellular solute-binding protein [Micromonosporaceae bacterium]
MRLRSWAALMAALAGLGAASACSSGTGSNTDSGAGGSTIRVSATVSDKEAMEAVIAAFKKQNPNDTVKGEYLDTEPMQAAIRTQLAAGNAWDVMFVWPGNGNPGALQVLQPNGYLTDLSDQSWAGQIPEGLKSVTQVDGKTFLLPMAFSGVGAIYNETALQAIGATPPKTWTELLAFCDTAKAKGKVAFALGNQTNWVTQLVNYALVPTTVYAKNPDFDQQMQAGTAKFVGSGWETAMNKYLEMNARGCFQANPVGTSVDAATTQAAQGQAVGIVQGTFQLAALQKSAPAGTNFVMTALPATDNPAEFLMAGAAGASFGVNTKTKNKELAMKFLNFMAQPETMNLWATTGGSLPAFPNDKFTASPTLAEFIKYQKDGKTVPFMDQRWPSSKVQAVHLTGVQDMFAGKAKPTDVLAQMDAEYQKK